jgi:hypothetical protein
MPDATFERPDLSKFCRLDELGLRVVGQRLEADRVVLACRAGEGGLDRWCRRCGAEAAVRDTVTRRLAHEPFGWRPTTLLVTIRRYRCTGCARVWRQDISRAAVCCGQDLASSPDPDHRRSARRPFQVRPFPVLWDQSPTGVGTESTALLRAPGRRVR